jgi:hypothetical protein
MISLAPALVGGVRSYIIVFSSNAPDPKNFDGTEGTLAQDANSEIWIYRVPAVADVDLTLGADLPLQDLSVGTFFQSRIHLRLACLPQAEFDHDGTQISPFFADDNREPSITDDGAIIAFISTRTLVGATATLTPIRNYSSTTSAPPVLHKPRTHRTLQLELDLLLRVIPICLRMGR